MASCDTASAPGCVAVDNSHFAYPDHGHGWLMVRSEKLTQALILNAVRSGHFYASMGPEIYDVQKDGNKVTVRCSPAQSIYLVGDYYYCPTQPGLGRRTDYDGDLRATANAEIFPD